jgi:hypothetical protein
MSFKVYRGKTKTVWLPVTVSTVLTKDSIVALSSGQIVAATSTSAANTHIGVTPKAIVATDADYATARTHPVIVPVEENVEWLATTTATAVVADVGLWVDLTDSATINRAASTYDVAQVRRFVSTTQLVVKLNLGGAVNTIV